MAKRGKRHKNQNKPNLQKSKRKSSNHSDLAAQLSKLSLTIRPIAGDGNCLFRALSDQLENTPNNHAHYRAAVCKFLRSHKDEYSLFIMDDEDFDKYVTRMEKPGVFGGNLELAVFSRIFDAVVNIHQLDQPVWQIDNCENNGARKHTIHVAYHSWEHYESVRDANGGLPGDSVVLTPNGESPAGQKSEGPQDGEKESTVHEEVPTYQEVDSDEGKNDLIEQAAFIPVNGLHEDQEKKSPAVSDDEKEDTYTKNDTLKPTPKKKKETKSEKKKKQKEQARLKKLAKSQAKSAPSLPIASLINTSPVDVITEKIKVIKI